MNAALRQSLARRVCGSLSVLVAGEACVLRCSGALWLPAHGTLIAADLHLEKGSAFAMRGQMLPPYDSRATLDRLEGEIAALDPASVILLGDSFHDTRAIPRMAADDRARLDRLAHGRDWLWLEGNHDREALARDAEATGRLPGRIVGGLSLGRLRLVHEPESLSADDEIARRRRRLFAGDAPALEEGVGVGDQLGRVGREQEARGHGIVGRLAHGSTVDGGHENTLVVGQHPTVGVEDSPAFGQQQNRARPHLGDHLLAVAGLADG